jgi:hypothetical protein
MYGSSPYQRPRNTGPKIPQVPGVPSPRMRGDLLPRTGAQGAPMARTPEQWNAASGHYQAQAPQANGGSMPMTPRPPHMQGPPRPMPRVSPQQYDAHIMSGVRHGMPDPRRAAMMHLLKQMQINKQASSRRSAF